MDPFAIAGLIVGVFSLLISCCCNLLGTPFDLVAIALGGVALSRIGKDPNLRGKEIAIAAIVCGGIGLVLAIIMFVVGMSVQNMPQYQQY